MKAVCVYGSSSSLIDNIYLDAGHRLGELITENGWSLVFGAGTTGMMGATARGAHSKDGGHVIGVIPEFMNIPGIPYEECDEYIVLNTMRERKKKLEDLSDAFITTAGGFGTFEELLEIVTLKQLKQHKKPVIILNTNSFYDEMLAMFETTVNQKFAKRDSLSVYTVVSTPEEAIDAIKNYQYIETDRKWFAPEAP